MDAVSAGIYANGKSVRLVVEWNVRARGTVGAVVAVAVSIHLRGLAAEVTHTSVVTEPRSEWGVVCAATRSGCESVVIVDGARQSLSSSMYT